MEIYASFQGISLIMILITVVFFSYKNWINVSKNRIYFGMIIVMSVVLTVNMSLLSVICLKVEHWKEHILIYRLFGSAATLLLILHLFMYCLAVTGKNEYRKTKLFMIIMFLYLSCFLAPVILVVLDRCFIRLEEFKVIVSIVRWTIALAICLLLIGCEQVLWVNRKKIIKRDFVILFTSIVILLVNVIFNRIFDENSAISFFVLSLIFVFYYLLIHNIDRFRFLSSGCLSRMGFEEVVKEKERYKQECKCIGVCINNSESITDYCSQSEIDVVYRTLGTLLKGLFGRHRVYHNHSFEYVVAVKDSTTVEEIHEKLLEELPDYIRINDKNVSLYYSFYTVSFSDAKYSAGNLYSILTSMKKKALEQFDKTCIVRYSGQADDGIKKDLEAMRIVNTELSRKNFALHMAILNSNKKAGERSYEISICENYRDGGDISQEDIWMLADEMGCSEVLGKIVFELVCKYIKTNKIQEKNVKRVHINLSALQIEGKEIGQYYLDCIRRYDISPEFICVEITMELNADYQKIQEAIECLRGAGVYMLLDQFGVTVCNLKNVLNLPFDAVKINHHMVRKYCEGKSNQLKFLIDMLNSSGWEVYLDGIDDKRNIEKLGIFDYAFAQGQIYQKDFEKHHKIQRINDREEFAYD